VDRTPFHDEFVRANLKAKDEVRLLKQFLTGIGCYGAEAKIEGISGYLCELLVIKYGSFQGVLEAAKNWRVGEVVQINELAIEKEKFRSPLIFIDPVDRNRNVASAMSEEKFSTFIFAAKEFLKRPREEFFFPKPRAVDRGKLIEKFRQRGTDVISIIFARPDVVDDILYTQLRKALNALKNLLERADFSVVGAGFSASKRLCIFIELESILIPAARLHLGPIANSPHEERFLEKYEDYKEKLTEPFIKGNRWCIFLKRKYTDAKAFLEEFLSNANLEEKGIPKYIAESFEKGVSIKVNEAVFVDEFLPDFQNYFDPRFPWES